jgi:two-component system, OmpR family, KDP operon response regulator KdpE
MVNESGQILIVDDEPQIRRGLRAILVTQGYEVWDARRGDEALNLIRSENFDLVLLEVNLPDMTGIEVCREIRAGFEVVIIMLTVRSSERDKVAAFDSGADDYVTKPFDTLELLARVRAHLRQHKSPARLDSDSFRSDDFVIDFAGRTVTRQENMMRLSPKQCQLLRYLVSNRGKPLSHRTLLRAIWGPDYGEETMLLQALVAQVRKKIEPNPSQPRYVMTIPWVGYRFD